VDDLGARQADEEIKVRGIWVSNHRKIARFSYVRDVRTTEPSRGTNMALVSPVGATRGGGTGAAWIDRSRRHRRS
jgi:hypothetical protein